MDVRCDVMPYMSQLISLTDIFLEAIVAAREHGWCAHGEVYAI